MKNAIYTTMIHKTDMEKLERRREWLEKINAALIKQIGRMKNDNTRLSNKLTKIGTNFS